MRTPTLTVYSKSSNMDILRLFNGESPVKLDSVTKVELRLDKCLFISSESHPDIISWSRGSEKIGFIYLRLGRATLLSKVYLAELLVFDELNVNGIFFGYIRINSIERCYNGTIS